MSGTSRLGPRPNRVLHQPVDSLVAGQLTDTPRGSQSGIMVAGEATPRVPDIGADHNRDSPLPGPSHNKGPGKKTKSQVRPRASSERRVLDFSDKE